ncbi:MAG: tyrosine-type recombinase/integrase [Dehalococcoidia bacterium]|nr:tyrosine-type recombinase/integrase [Dehalococcoidia bacterium]
MSRPDALKLLNKTPTSTIAKTSGLSKSYISQVKNGKREPSEKLLVALLKLQPDTHKKKQRAIDTALQQFLKSRRQGISPHTIRDYQQTLSKALYSLGLSPTTEQINRYLRSLNCSLGGKYGYFKNLRAFYNWLYSPRSGLLFKSEDNPVTWVDAPKRPFLILPSLTAEQVQQLICECNSVRDKAIISLFTESGLRLVELTNIRQTDINWGNRTIRTLGKGSKEAYAPFGEMSEKYLRAWLAEYNSNGSTIWGLNRWGIVSMLNRLERKTGLTCNPHTFRRTFACLLRKAGVDVMTIKDLGRWESLEMVQRYTRSVTFHDSLKHYKAPLSQ